MKRKSLSQDNLLGMKPEPHVISEDLSQD